MPQLKILKSTVADGRDVFAGAVETVSAKAAADLIGLGYAEIHADAPAAPEAPAAPAPDAPADLSGMSGPAADVSHAIVEVAAPAAEAPAPQPEAVTVSGPAGARTVKSKKR